MGELKPIGSEKLKGDAKLKRILDLTYYQSNDILKESKNDSVEATKEGKTGIYAIQKEKDGYYVKKGLNENSLDYIGGLFMKNKNRFTSYSEAFKKMEFLVEQEIAETKILQEATKYVLKQPKPAAPPVAPAPVEPVSPMPAETPPEPEGDIPPIEGGDEEIPDNNVENELDYMSVLKKLAGKLQQKINKYEDKLESVEYKEIIKQILSAVDVERLDPDDLEEILSVFDDEEAEMDATGETPMPAEDGVEPVEATEMDGIASLDELINTPLDEYDEYEDEDDDTLVGFDDSFLDDEEVQRAEKFAKKDLGIDSDAVKFDKSEIDTFPIYGGGDEEDEDGFGGDKFDDETDLDEEIPLPSNDQGMGDIDDNDDVRELDLDELTNMVNNSVKDSLGKYFE